MKPYYEEKGITIYHGDCKEILPSLESVDLVVTDPPYGIEFQSNHRIIKHDSIPNDDEFPFAMVKALVSGLVAMNASYIFCRWDTLRSMLLPKPRSVLAWVKNNWSMGDLEHEHGRQWEAICFYPNAGHQFIKRIPDVIFADRTGNVVHPTEKPISLLKALISANVGNVVLDPFMGSGTTLRAAKDLGRQAIGIEIKEEYCEIAAKRLAQEVLEFS